MATSILRCLTLASALGLAGCASPGPRSQPPVVESSPDEPAEDTEALVDAHNQVRARFRRPPLTVDPRLEAAAQMHADDMAQRNRLRHRGGDGSSPFERMQTQGYPFERAAENIACGQTMIAEVMRGWMTSPGHRRNILGKYSQIGTACAIAKDGTRYWCVTFGQPTGADHPSRPSIVGYP